ncbi:helix-turn-helix domain-containing protein [Anaerophilus nitritogenes]|uniref:helix-turn-helix domain-containing protein n=1 Tax=Anaerophilus nitritogenes TaxID=2498136 RepID=UPI00101CA26D
MLGKKLKKLRNQANITQSELSKAVKVTTSSIGMYETGTRKPSYEVLKRIANYFNVSIDYFFEDDKKEQTYQNDEIDTLEEEMKLFYSKVKNLSKADREKILKMIEIFESETEN